MVPESRDESTLDVFELSSPQSRPVRSAVLDSALSGSVGAGGEVLAAAKREGQVHGAAFKKAMEFDRAFVKAVGCSAQDPIRAAECRRRLRRQRNYELLVEAASRRSRPSRS